MKKKRHLWIIAAASFLIIALLTVPLFLDCLERAGIARPITDLRIIGASLFQYRIARGEYPETLQGVIEEKDISEDTLEAIKNGKLVYIRPTSSNPSEKDVLLRYRLDKKASVIYTCGNSASFVKE